MEFRDFGYILVSDCVAFDRERHKVLTNSNDVQCRLVGAAIFSQLESWPYGDGVYL